MTLLKEQPRVTADDLWKALPRRYPQTEYALFSQVRNATGFASRIRTADAIALSLWPSRGLALYGFEFKIHRSDWMKEKATPEKAEEIAQYCDYWLVVTPPGLVQLEELPSSWGLIEWNGEKWRCRSAGKKLKAKSLDRSFVASMMRSVAANYVPRADVDQLANSMLAEKTESIKQAGEFARQALKELQETVRKFEDASGVRIQDSWQREKIGPAVRLVLNGEVALQGERLAHLREAAARILTDIDNTLSTAREAGHLIDWPKRGEQ